MFEKLTIEIAERLVLGAMTATKSNPVILVAVAVCDPDGRLLWLYPSSDSRLTKDAAIVAEEKARLALSIEHPFPGAAIIRNDKGVAIGSVGVCAHSGYDDRLVRAVLKRATGLLVYENVSVS